MRSTKFGIAAALALALGIFAFASVINADEKDKPKHDVKEVMKLAHKGKDSLANKVIAGKGSDDDKKELVELYVDLSKNPAPKGSAESWKTKTEAVVKAAKEVEEGKAGAGADLKKAINCAGCHKAHKP